MIKHKNSNKPNGLIGFEQFEANWVKIQEQKELEAKAKIAKLDEEFPQQERTMRLAQSKAAEESAKRAAELEKYDPGVEIDTSKFKPLSAEEIIEILGSTIKKDESNKLITFLAQVSCYTENSQLNISFNAPSSSGKSFIPTEIASLFPQEDVIEVGYCSPTAFFHDVGKFEEDKQGYTVDLSRKILIFLDQPHTLLLQHLRPMLSHDKKEIRLKITDKSQKAGLKTKNIFLIGFPAVIFCTAGLELDEQEATRFLLLSPEVNQEKIREAIFEKIKKESDSVKYKFAVESDPQRQLLKERLRAIKQEGITDIKIESPSLVEQLFFERVKVLKPRHQRDVARILSIVKIFALINMWFRERRDTTIIATDEDIKEAFKVWDTVSESQELNLPPYVLNIYKDVIIPDFLSHNQGIENVGVGVIGLTRRNISDKHYQTYGRILPDWQLRQQILPLLETAGLITQEPDEKDKRKILIYPTTQLTISKPQNNSESEGRVKTKTIDQLSEDEQLELAKSIFGEGTKWAEEPII